MNDSSFVTTAEYQQGLRDARKACIAEHLDDPQDESDTAYDLAIRHCVTAIEKLMNHQVAPKDSSCK